MFAASKTAAVSGAGPDDKFNYVTMLLHGDGTNGAQNNTFLDSSTNNFAITRNGNTTQGSFSPYGSNWSNYFSGTTGQYLSVANNAANQLGTGDFTVECWVNTNSADNTGIFQIGGALNAFATTPLLFVSNYVSNTIQWGYDTDYSSVSMNPNTWNHLAVVRQSGTTKIYVNGTLAGTKTTSVNLTTGPVWLGVYYQDSFNLAGYISNFRIVKGTAVYTSNFTPSTTPLTAISGTGLLTCQSNRFIDNSSNALTVTVNGSPSVQRFNPFGTSTAYSTSVIGGSGYFDKSGDYLDGPTNSAFAFGTGDFTISAWVYVLNGTSAQIIWTNQTTSSANAPNIGFFILNNKVCLNNTNTAHVESTGTIANNSWNYIGVTRASGTYTFYINGSTSGTTGTIGTDNITENACHIGYGNYGTSYYFGGYIADLRIIKGSAVAPTVPTAPVGTVTNTQLLLNMQNGAIYDNAMMNNLETVSNAQISTSVVKYGTGSLNFNGTTDYLVTYKALNLRMGGGDMTIECWIYPTSKTGWRGIFSKGNVNQYEYSLGWEDSVLTARLNDNGSFTVTDTVNLNAWNHIAYVRNGTTFTVYINGVAEGSTTASTSFSTTQSNEPFLVGYYDFIGNSAYYVGYIDDLRITKGYARYTSTFTPPTAAFSDTGPY